MLYFAESPLAIAVATESGRVYESPKVVSRFWMGYPYWAASTGAKHHYNP
jgi:hypothetical protein